MDLPLHLTQFHQRDAFWTAMQGDKKSIAGEVRFVISQGIGSCKLPQGLARDFIEGVLSQGNP
jgi:3-dehydroquinate synthetase